MKEGETSRRTETEGERGAERDAGRVGRQLMLRWETEQMFLSSCELTR